ncbi:MAG: SctK family type III secretion system sorting platform protein [Puniceicoccales bacterium]|jgi:hypothetical protein|nr:SctK family type III secretion system sorting platform protein [Puniceicoccales bacterium]
MEWDEIIKEWRVAWEIDGGDECMNFLRFLYEPASYVHRSRLEKIFCNFSCARTIAETRRGWLAMNGKLLEFYRLNSPSRNGPRLLQRQRIIYDDPLKLQRLVNIAGALVCSSEIQVVVTNRSHHSLLGTIGDEAYGFALRKTVFFADEIARLSRKDIPAASLPRRVATVGRWCVASCLHGMAKDVKRRFVLKFPEGSGWKLAIDLADEPLEEAWNLVERLRARIN